MTANPFDNVLGMNNDKEETISTETSTKKNNKDKMHISISIDKKTVERAVFIIIIIVLAAFVFINPFGENGQCKENSNTATISGAITAEKNDTAEIIVSSAQETQPVDNSSTKEDKTEQKAEETNNDNLPFKTNFDFKIETVDYYKCGDLNDDCDDNNKPAKMKSIKFMMTNRWKDFRPKIEAYWYDKDSSDPIKSKIRTTLLLGTIKKGEIQKVTIDRFDSTFFDPTNKAETIELKMYNRENGLLMGTTTYSIG